MSEVIDSYRIKTVRLAEKKPNIILISFIIGLGIVILGYAMVRRV